MQRHYTVNTIKNDSLICEAKGHPGPETLSFDRRLKVFNTLLLSCCTSACHIPLRPNTLPNHFAVKMKDISGYILFLNLGPNDFNILREIISMPECHRKHRNADYSAAAVTVTYL